MNKKNKIIIVLLVTLVALIFLVWYNANLIKQNPDYGKRMIKCPNGSLEEYNESNIMFCGKFFYPQPTIEIKDINLEIMEVIKNNGN